MDRTQEHAELLRRARVNARIGSDRIVVDLTTASHWMTLLTSLLACGLVLIIAYFAAGALLPAGVPPTGYVIAGVVMSVLLSISLASARFFRNADGSEHLTIDRVTRDLTLPCNFGRSQPVVVPLHSITKIRPAEATAQTDIAMLSDDAIGARRYKLLRIAAGRPVRDLGHRESMLYAVVIAWRAHDHQSERLEVIASWYDHPRSDALAHWLCLQCNVPIDDQHHSGPARS